MNNSYCNYYESSALFHGSLLDIMGTRFDVLIVTESQETGEDIWNEIQSELLRLDKLFNCFDAGSEVSMINSGAYTKPITVSPEMWEVLLGCKRYHEQTMSLFDITLKDFKKVLLNENNKSVSFLEKDIHLDFGGYAKGYAIERINDIIKRYSIRNSFINFGNSSIYALGTHPYGDCWSIGIENPYKKGEILGEVKLKDEGVSTSGNMPSNPKHIVNPLTGDFNEEKKIVSVKSKNAIDAEVLSTSLMIAQNEEIKKIKDKFSASEISIYKI